MAFFGDIIGFIIPLVIIFSVVSALGGNKGRQTGRGGASSFGGTNLNRMNLDRLNPDRPVRNSMDPDRNLDSSDVMGSPQESSDRSMQDFNGQQTVGNLGNFLGDIMGTRRAETSGNRSTYVPGRSEPLSTMKKAQEDQRATSTIEREKRYAYDGQSSQSKSSTRDQIEREKRYSYDTQGYESKASNYVNAPGAVLQKASAGVAMRSAAEKRQESFIGGMGSEFLDSADQYLKMGDYHLTHKPGGLYSYSGSNYDLKTLNLKGKGTVVAAAFREVEQAADRK
jgi:hypothetical protein